MEAKGWTGKNSLRRGRWYIAGGIAVLAIAAMFTGTGMLSALAMHASYGAAADPVITCPGEKTLKLGSSNSMPAKYHPVLVLSLTWKVVNDEDSGWAGYWAMDSYVTVLKVWQLTAGSLAGLYVVEKTYKGYFQVPQGARSPGVTGTTPNAVPEPAPGYGTMVGEYGALININGGTFNAGGLPTSGNLGTMNYGGTTSDILLATGQTGSPTPYDWVTAYFGASALFTYAGTGGTAWGWVYTLNSFFQSPTSVNVWCNFGTGNYGDIVTAS